VIMASLHAEVKTETFSHMLNSHNSPVHNLHHLTPLLTKYEYEASSHHHHHHHHLNISNNNNSILATTPLPSMDSNNAAFLAAAVSVVKAFREDNSNNINNSNLQSLRSDGGGSLIFMDEGNEQHTISLYPSHHQLDSTQLSHHHHNQLSRPSPLMYVSQVSPPPTPEESKSVVEDVVIKEHKTGRSRKPTKSDNAKTANKKSRGKAAPSKKTTKNVLPSSEELDFSPVSVEEKKLQRKETKNALKLRLLECLMDASESVDNYYRLKFDDGSEAGDDDLFDGDDQGGDEGSSECGSSLYSVPTTSSTEVGGKEQPGGKKKGRKGSGGDDSNGGDLKARKRNRSQVRSLDIMTNFLKYFGV